MQPPLWEGVEVETRWLHFGSKRVSLFLGITCRQVPDERSSFGRRRVSKTPAYAERHYSLRPTVFKVTFVEHLLKAVEDAVEHCNWYAALMVTLTLPDICANIDGREGTSSARYISWARDWIEPAYVREIPAASPVDFFEKYLALRRRPDTEANRAALKQYEEEAHRKEKVLFLKAGDLYALRCAYCHEASHDLEKHKAKEVLERFNISAPSSNNSLVHLNWGDDSLQLQVDCFCLEICACVRCWLADRAENPQVKSNLSRLALISPITWI